MTETRRRPWLRMLRGTVSALCLTLCAAFVLLWVRSYSTRDTLVEVKPTLSRFLVSWRGGIFYSVHVHHQLDERVPWTWQVHKPVAKPPRLLPNWAFKFDLFVGPDGSVFVRAPHWVGVTLAAGGLAILAIKPRWRFSVFHLLLFMTLIALLAGGIIVLSRMRWDAVRTNTQIDE